LPVVLVLHGGHGNAKYAEKQTWMSKAADRHAFIVVYSEALIGPENPDANLKYQHWNGGPRVDPNKSPDVDDVGFISVMHIHGEEDIFIPVEGGIGPKLPDYWNPVDATLSEWAERNVCQRVEETDISKQAACTNHLSCEDDSEVTLCVVRNHGHTWPGKGVYMGSKACQFNPRGFICKRLIKEIGHRNYDFPVDDIVWEFFKKHPLRQ
jgi:poly(3-hydroxybutyrate) depolymerase